MLNKAKPQHVGLIYLGEDLNASRNLVSSVCAKAKGLFVHLIFVSFSSRELDDSIKALLHESELSYSFHFYAYHKNIRGLVFKEQMLEAFSQGQHYLVQFNEGAMECLR